MKIIAEFCQNHNGQKNIITSMIKEASNAGATHAKLQHIFARNLTYRSQFELGLIKNKKIISIKRPFLEEYKRLKNLEINYKTVDFFISQCAKYNLIPLTTCFTRGDIGELKNLGFEEIKVASYDCASFQMIRELTKNFKTLYLSTGATFDSEIKLTTQILNKNKIKFFLLHCVTKYPTELNDFNLNKMLWLKSFTNNIGLSDHSLVSRDGIFASKVAMYLGANVIERHFTILSEDKTKDGPVSINPKQLYELKIFSKLSKKKQLDDIQSHNPKWKKILMGKSNRVLSDTELLNRDYYRGRFATPRFKGVNNSNTMIFNWEETPIK